MVVCIYKLYVQRRGRNGKHESSEFSSRWDVLPEEFVSSDLQDKQYQVAFEDLKKEILVGHQEIAQGKVTSVADVRKEFGLD